MARNGISTLRAGMRNAKGKRQLAKLKLAAAKRKGYTIVEGDPGNVISGNRGIWNQSGPIDSSKVGYRANHYYVLYRLPMRYNVHNGVIADFQWTTPSGTYEHNADPALSADLIDQGGQAVSRPWRDSAPDNPA